MDGSTAPAKLMPDGVRPDDKFLGVLPLFHIYGMTRDDDAPQLLERERPSPDPGEALVRTLRVGVDGTDHEVLNGSHGGFPDGADHMSSATKPSASSKTRTAPDSRQATWSSRRSDGRPTAGTSTSPRRTRYGT